MPYFLRHHFEPDLTTRHLRPTATCSHRVDHRNLGFVQNVVMDQVLAEFVEVSPEEAAKRDPRFVYETMEFPAGRNTMVHPAVPSQLLATANGHVSYDDGLIVVKKALRIGRDVDYHTGNIFFVGDLLVEGSLRSGFEVHARNALIKNMVEGARVVAESSIICESGVKGGKRARLFAGTNIRVPFCENATLVAREAIVVDGACMHCELRAKKKLVVKGRLQGGVTHCNGTVYVGEQLGGGTSTETRVHLGSDPFLTMRLDDVQESIETLENTIAEYAAHTDKGGELAEEFGPLLEQAQRKLTAHQSRKQKLETALDTSRNEEGCRLVVPGVVRSGVRITIGEASLMVNEHHENVHYRLIDGEIVMRSPAIKSA